MSLIFRNQALFYTSSALKTKFLIFIFFQSLLLTSSHSSSVHQVLSVDLIVKKKCWTFIWRPRKSNPPARLPSFYRGRGRGGGHRLGSDMRVLVDTSSCLRSKPWGFLNWPEIVTRAPRVWAASRCLGIKKSLSFFFAPSSTQNDRGQYTKLLLLFSVSMFHFFLKRFSQQLILGDE